MDKITRMKELIQILNKASYAYYAKDNPIMSDKEYDDLYDELSELEYSTGIHMAGSPSQSVQGYVIDSLQKVKHTKPMLSANKTKDIQEIKKFIGNRPCIVSWKEDGLTIVLRYKSGKFVQAITRGTGEIGEDVTHTMRMCKNIPLKLPYVDDLEVRGECVISWKEFNRINEKLEEPYKHPRNLAAGSVRQLDPNILKDRELTYKAFELVQDEEYEESKEHPIVGEQILDIGDSFEYLAECGFDVVEYDFVTRDNVEEVIKKYIPENYDYPVDGLIFEYNDYFYGKSLGATEHHPLNMMALKFKDELYETTLTDIEWNTSKTGLINPVAVFNPVDLDGATTTRATLHNISYIEDLQLGVGDTIRVYRANMVIPKVHDNLTRSNTWKLPDKCPTCGGKVKVHQENGSKTLYCTNPECPARLLGKLTHFVSRSAINIDGLSEQTLQKFIELGWVKSFKDIMHLKQYENRMIALEGFGKRSVQKLLDSIEAAKHTTFQRFLYSLSIPLIGKSASKDISKVCDNLDSFCSIIDSDGEYAFTSIDGFGTEMNKSLISWWKENKNMCYELAKEFIFEENNASSREYSNGKIKNKTFCITGSLTQFKNRDELVKTIEEMGGKVTGSVTSKTNYLINNDTESNSSKNKKAKELNIPIISETDFIRMYK